MSLSEHKRGKHALPESQDLDDQLDADDEVEPVDDSAEPGSPEQGAEEESASGEAASDETEALVSDDESLTEEEAADETVALAPVAEAVTEVLEPLEAATSEEEASDENDIDDDGALESEPAVSHTPHREKAKHGKHVASSYSGTVSRAAIMAPAPEPIDPAEMVGASFGEIPLKKKRKGLKAFGIGLGVLLGVLLVVYVAGAIVFMGRMAPNTKIGEYNISLKTNDEVVEQLDKIVSNYQLDVIGTGFSYRTDGEGIGMAIDSKGIVDSIHQDLNAWTWPVLVLNGTHDETERLKVSFNRQAYEPEVTAAVAKYNETAAPPVNATIMYDEKAAKFVVKPEEKGTQLDVQAVLDATAKAIEELQPKVLLSDDQLVKPTVLSTDQKLIDAAALATGMVSADLSLVLAGQQVGAINGETLSPFITIDDKFQVVFREEDMVAWVEELADGFNTVGTERTYTRADGKEITVPAGGSYGWEIDNEALMEAILEGIRAGAKTTIDIPCAEEAAVYAGIGQRDWGNRYIDVDLSEQYVRFYGDDGSLIWETACISGMPDGTHNTVPGTWYINYKESPSKLIGYENGKKIYETTVTYWMPFEGNGIGFHDATWQPSFGGSMYANGYGSHGCVNLSYSAAESLYGIVQVGDPVVVHF